MAERGMWGGFIRSRVLLGAPLRGFRPLAVFGAVFVACLVLGLTASSAPLFVGSTSSASVTNQVAARCPADLGIKVFGSSATPARDAARISAMTAGVPALEPLTGSYVSTQTLLFGGGLQAITTTIARPGQERHITMVSDAGGAGLLLPDRTAKVLNTHAGGTVELGTALGNVKPFAMRVAGTYVDLNRQPRQQFWCDPLLAVYGHGLLDENPPPPVTLVRGGTAVAAVTRQIGWPILYQRPVRAPLTLPQARTVLAAERRVSATLAGGAGPLVSASDVSGSGLGELAFVVRRAQDVGTSLSSAASAIAGAGSALALLLVAGCGVLWADRRRSELRLLSSRGVPGSGLALMAVGELVIPTVLGAAAGWAVARVLVPGVGPSGLEPSAQLTDALTRAGYAAAGALVVLFCAVWLSVRGAGDAARQHASRRRVAAVVRWVPVELIALAAAALTYRMAAGRGLATFADSGIPHLRAVDLLFPILAVVGGGLLVARVVVLSLRGRRRVPGRQAAAPRRGRSGGPGWFLARRRLAGAPRVPAVLVSSTALAVGVLLFSLTITATLSYTAAAKGKVYVGTTAVAAFITPPKKLPPALQSGSTPVVRADTVSAAGQLADVIAVDPRTFADAAFWDDRFAGVSLPRLLARLPGRSDGRIPAIVTGAGMPAAFDVKLPAPGGVTVTLPVFTAASTNVFPGEQSRPLIVIARANLPAPAAAFAENQLWLRTFGPAQLAAVGSDGIQLRDVLTTHDVDQVPTIEVITWAYGFFEALGAVVAIIAFGGLLLHLATRQRARAVAYTLARRMGLRRRTHWWSLVAEIAVGTAVGALTGTAVALAAARIVSPHLDPQPGLPPAPLFEAPWPAVAGVLVGVLALTFFAAGVGQHQADRARSAELLRLT